MRHLSSWAEPKLSQACRSGAEGSRACRGIVAAPAAMDGSRMTSRSKRLGRCRGWNPRANELVRTTTSTSPHSRLKDRGTDIPPPPVLLLSGIGVQDAVRLLAETPAARAAGGQSNPAGAGTFYTPIWQQKQ